MYFALLYYQGEHTTVNKIIKLCSINIDYNIYFSTKYIKKESKKLNII